MAGLYIASVRSRTRATRNPRPTICLMAKDLFRMHMFVCTPRMSRLPMSYMRRKLKISCP